MHKHIYISIFTHIYIHAVSAATPLSLHKWHVRLLLGNVYIYIYICTTHSYTNTHTSMYIYFYIYIYIYTQIYTHTYIYVYIHTHIYTYTYAPFLLQYIHLFIKGHVRLLLGCINTNIYTHTYVYIHTYISTYIYTYSHTYIYIPTVSAALPPPLLQRACAAPHGICIYTNTHLYTNVHS